MQIHQFMDNVSVKLLLKVVPSNISTHFTMTEDNILILMKFVWDFLKDILQEYSEETLDQMT
jgi:hypothetical protein